MSALLMLCNRAKSSFKSFHHSILPSDSHAGERPSAPPLRSDFLGLSNSPQSSQPGDTYILELCPQAWSMGLQFDITLIEDFKLIVFKDILSVDSYQTVFPCCRAGCASTKDLRIFAEHKPITLPSHALIGAHRSDTIFMRPDDLARLPEHSEASDGNLCRGNFPVERTRVANPAGRHASMLWRVMALT